MFGFVSGSGKESRGIELVLEEGATSPGRHGYRASKQLPDDPDLVVAELPVGSHQSQLFNKGLSDEQFGRRDPCDSRAASKFSGRGSDVWAKPESHSRPASCCITRFERIPYFECPQDPLGCTLLTAGSSLVARANGGLGRATKEDVFVNRKQLKDEDPFLNSAKAPVPGEVQIAPPRSGAHRGTGGGGWSARSRPVRVVQEIPPLPAHGGQGDVKECMTGLVELCFRISSLEDRSEDDQKVPNFAVIVAAVEVVESGICTTMGTHISAVDFSVTSRVTNEQRANRLALRSRVSARRKF